MPQKKTKRTGLNLPQTKSSSNSKKTPQDNPILSLISRFKQKFENFIQPSLDTMDTMYAIPPNDPVMRDLFKFKRKTKLNVEADQASFNSFKGFIDGKGRYFIKLYPEMFLINNFTMSDVIAYSIIRNTIITENMVSQRKGTKDFTGYSAIVNNALFERIHFPLRSLQRSLTTLSDAGFILVEKDEEDKRARKITLLRDMESFQPEEIFAVYEWVQKYVDSMNEETQEDIQTKQSQLDMKKQAEAQEQKDNEKLNNILTPAQMAKIIADRKHKAELDRQFKEEFGDFEF